MIRANRIAKLAIGVSTLSLLSMSQTVQANEFTDLFKQFLRDQTFGYAPANDPITAREKAVSDRIVEAISSNKLNSQQSLTIKAEYDRVKEMERQYRASGNQLDQIEVTSLNTELNKLDSTLTQMLSSNTATPPSTTAQTDDTDTRLKELLYRITGALASGRLTIEEASALRSDYERALSNRNRLRADGSLSTDELNQLNDEMRQLSRKIRENTHDAQAWSGIDGQQALQAQRINEAVNSGKITRREFDLLKADSDRVFSMETKARANGLQLDETIALATELDKFKARVDASLNNVASNPGGSGTAGQGGSWGGSGNSGQGGGGWGGSSFDGRQAGVMQRIQEGQTSGKLTADEAEDLKYDMHRLEQLERSYKATHNQLTPQEIEVLNKGLNSIITQLNEKLNDIADAHPEIDKKQADLGVRIDAMMRNGQLKATDGTALKAKLAWIATVEATMRQSGGSLDSTEAANLNQDLDRIAQRLDKSGPNPAVEIASRKASLLKQIDDGTSYGALTPLESKILKDQYQHIGWLETRLAKNGKLEASDQFEIINELNRLSTMITQELSDRTRMGRGRNWYRTAGGTR